MEIDKETFEAMIVLLFKLEETEACEALFEVYKKYVADDIEDQENPIVH